MATQWTTRLLTLTFALILHSAVQTSGYASNVEEEKWDVIIFDDQSLVVGEVKSLNNSSRFIFIERITDSDLVELSPKESDGIWRLPRDRVAQIYFGASAKQVTRLWEQHIQRPDAETRESTEPAPSNEKKNPPVEQNAPQHPLTTEMHNEKDFTVLFGYSAVKPPAIDHVTQGFKNTLGIRSPFVVGLKRYWICVENTSKSKVIGFGMNHRNNFALRERRGIAHDQIPSIFTDEFGNSFRASSRNWSRILSADEMMLGPGESGLVILELTTNPIAPSTVEITIPYEFITNTDGTPLLRKDLTKQWAIPAGTFESDFE